MSEAIAAALIGSAFLIGLGAGMFLMTLVMDKYVRTMERERDAALTLARPVRVAVKIPQGGP